jgi:phospholipase/carboxylesterase
MPELDTIVLETGEKPDTAVIWLHGLGANGNDFVPVVQQLRLPADLAIRFIFPHAPIRPITINQGYEMPGWYDISSLSIIDGEDVDGINESGEALRQLCEQQEEQGIVSTRIILAGFSQGGAIALHCGLNFPRPLAGIMALSTYLPRCTPLDTGSATANLATPLFMAHGTEDDVVAHHYGKSSYERLQNAGYRVFWHEYPMAHSVCMEEIEDIQHWLLGCLQKPQA